MQLPRVDSAQTTWWQSQITRINLTDGLGHANKDTVVPTLTAIRKGYLVLIAQRLRPKCRPHLLRGLLLADRCRPVVDLGLRHKRLGNLPGVVVAPVLQ